MSDNTTIQSRYEEHLCQPRARIAGDAAWAGSTLLLALAMLMGCDSNNSPNLFTAPNAASVEVATTQLALEEATESSAVGVATQQHPHHGARLSGRRVEVDRGAFYVRDSGNVDGDPVIMLHGWPESSYVWAELAPYVDSGLRIIAPDLRGLGQSERTLDVQAYRKIELAKDILAIADAMGLSDFHLVGHDWGGIVAQEMAFLAPERVRKLVLSNIPVVTNYQGFLEVTEYLEGAKYFPYWYQYFQMQPNLPEAMIPGNEKAWITHFFGSNATNGTISPEAIAEYVKAYKIKHTPATAASLYRTISSDQAHWTELILAEARFPMPSLYIYGQNDSVIVPQNLKYLDCCFDSIRIEYLDTGHFVMDEQPQAFAELLNGFLL